MRVARPTVVVECTKMMTDHFAGWKLVCADEMRHGHHLFGVEHLHGGHQKWN